MSKYRIYYRETTNNEIEIEADTPQEAITILQNNTYINGPYVDSYEREIECMTELDASGEGRSVIRLPGFKRN